ncbi:MAG: MoaD/ThiS family protein [Alphaproteobacteria bacterium]
MRILYFAKISEELGKNEDLLLIKDKLRIIDVVNILKKKNEKYNLVFKKISNIKFAINCEYATKNDYITDNDELAIFPPVTGG